MAINTHDKLVVALSCYTILSYASSCCSKYIRSTFWNSTQKKIEPITAKLFTVQCRHCLNRKLFLDDESSSLDIVYLLSSSLLSRFFTFYVLIVKLFISFCVDVCLGCCLGCCLVYCLVYCLDCCLINCLDCCLV